ncbi:hypothetical protein NUW58_g68 [Xylaria curta]|uniref:Uncharacterized protein n=1 Tax=Xylaria curta TaxID=42375 RepID=A0ACC1PRK2_9PEZI|nr:hypothetical protein NUW58_g68 [Xylaria curta]
MESLRAQLAETQGALTERDKKFRQLRADHHKAAKSWSEEKSALEARIRQLEAENLVLKGTPPATADEPGVPATLPQHKGRSPEIASTHKGTGKSSALKGQPNADADGDEKVTITRSRMKQAEAQFEKMAHEVVEKTELCKELEAKLSAPGLNLTDDEVKTRWNQLRDRIRTLSLDYLSHTFSANSVSEKLKREFRELSPHWKTYASTPNVTCYLFRAFIWRYILRYFEVFCRACGRNVSSKFGGAAEALSAKLPIAQYQEWLIRTATLVHKAYTIDKSLIDEITSKIAEAIVSLVGDTNAASLKTSIHDIVTMAAELSATFDQSRFVVLMSNEPGSTLTHGFPYVEA